MKARFLYFKKQKFTPTPIFGLILDYRKKEGEAASLRILLIQEDLLEIGVGVKNKKPPKAEKIKGKNSLSFPLQGKLK